MTDPPPNALQRAIDSASSGMAPFWLLPFTVYGQTRQADVALVTALAAGAVQSLVGAAQRAFLKPSHPPPFERVATAGPDGAALAIPGAPAALRPDHRVRSGPPAQARPGGAWYVHNLLLHGARALKGFPFRFLTGPAFVFAGYCFPLGAERAWPDALFWAGVLPMAASVAAFLSKSPLRSAAELRDLRDETKPPC